MIYPWRVGESRYFLDGTVRRFTSDGDWVVIGRWKP